MRKLVAAAVIVAVVVGAAIAGGQHKEVGMCYPCVTQKIHKEIVYQPVEWEVSNLR